MVTRQGRRRTVEQTRDSQRRKEIRDDIILTNVYVLAAARRRLIESWGTERTPSEALQFVADLNALQAAIEKERRKQ
jgi:hypothetical protein